MRGILGRLRFWHWPLALMLGSVLNHAALAEVTVYSARKEALILPVLDAFTAATGIEVRLLTANAAQLHVRLVEEADLSPADVLITSDAGNLHRAKQDGLLRAIHSAALDEAIAPRYRDPDGTWFGLSLRARVIVYAPDRADADVLESYEQLADPRWHGAIAVRSSQNVYNQSLIASLIAADGLEATESWARGLVNNFARPPKGGDTDQIRAVASGEADIALANSYYFARLLASGDDDDREVAAKVTVLFPNQNGRGAHVNVSGAGVTAHAPHPDEAQKLIEFMAGAEGQRLFAELNHEFPVRDGVPWSDVVAPWQGVKFDDLDLAVLGENSAQALRLADRAGWR